MNVAMLLEMAHEGMGDRVAVGSGATGQTYGELLVRSRQVASIIGAAGIDRLGFVGVNDPALPSLLFGCALAGVPFAPLNYRLPDDRLRSICERVAPAIVVGDDDSLRRLDGISGLDLRTAADLQGVPATSIVTEAADGDDVAIWLFTSGTTGEPKVAVLRHRHPVSYVLSTVEFMSAAEDEATLVSVPPYHIAGIATILSNTFAGRRLVYLPQFDPTAWVELAAHESVTHAMVVPTMLGRILDSLESRGATLPALRHLSYGGGRMPVSIVRRAMDLLPHVGFVNAYGLTETSSTIAVLGADDHRIAHASSDAGVQARLGSVGRPLASLELEIRDPSGAAVPLGECGEIYVRGEQVAGEYQGRSALTSDGWFPTNDAGYLDGSGFLFIEGRLDDVIVRGGENISPGEIEDVLLEHGAVEQVGVVALLDDEWGEVPAAAVVLRAGATATEPELQSWVRDRLRSSRVPVVIELRQELPYTETGKLLRRVLQTELRSMSGSAK